MAAPFLQPLGWVWLGFGSHSAPLAGTSIILGMAVTYPIHPTPTHMPGGELPCGGQKEGAGCGCCLLGRAGTTSPVPRHVPPVGCPEEPVPRAGETSHFDSSQPPAWKPSCLLLHVIPAQKRALLHPFLLQSAGLLRLQGKHTPKPPVRQFPRSAKEPHQGLAAEEPNLEACFFTNPKAEACWYSMYLEGLKSHLPVFNYLTVQCFP